jgi:arabinofuranan 3-O-arabinosyltransferase
MDTTVGGTRAAQVSPGPASCRLRLLGYALLAALAYVPVLLTKPGRVVADTKTYLYLDPGRLLERAVSMWDPNIGMGTVTHQNIGYLFPMGPYYWVFHLLGVPAWVSQRLWLGSIIFAAGLGVLYLLRTLHVRGPGVVVAALLFMLTPYTLDFAARISVILLPWAGLPWMLALAIRALRAGDGRAGTRGMSWRYPAIFAIVVQVIGGVNATALVFAGIAPVLWILYAVATGEVGWRHALKVTAKIGVLTLFASAWWIVGLSLQSGYGLNILKFTETLETVSDSSLASEVLRGLGYWFFYGIDKLGHWTDASVDYTQHLWLIAVSFAIPALALLAAGCIRWRHRAYFVGLTVVGVAVAVGAHPYDDPSVLGGLFKSFAESSSFGLALRSTSRAVPLVALGVAVLLGMGVNAVARAWAGRGRTVRGVPVRVLVVAGLVMALAVVNLPALWTGSFYTQSLTRAEDIPQYWTDAIGALDRQPHDTRVLEIPGADFAAYRWGQTVDPITPGLMDRPYVARELVPWGSAASADLLNALDRRLQEGVLDPAAIAPIARLMSVGSVVYRADLQTDRFNLARAVPTWLLLTDPVPPGLGTPTGYGSGLGPMLQLLQHDEVELALPPDAATPPPVSVFPVQQAPSILRSAPASSPLLVSGDGEGLVDLASIGALDGNRPVLYSATFAGDAARLRREVSRADSLLVVTDSNRKRARRWGGLVDTYGETERVDQTALRTDENDNRLDVFPDAGYDAYTVVQTPGVAVSTTKYGGNDSYLPELRGSRAFDGNIDTAWEVGAHTKVIGESLRLVVDRPITTDHLNLVQPQVGPNERYLTQVQLSFDGGAPVTVDLHEASRTPAGETVSFPRRTFRRLDVTIADTNVGDDARVPFANAVGIAELRVRDDAPGAEDVHVHEVVRMPTDLVDAAGASAAGRPLVYSISRSRDVVIPPRYTQDEPNLVRKFRVPDARTFSLGGTARLATEAPDDALDAVLGLPSAGAGGITVTASQHLPGDIASRGSSAFDGDPSTAWSTAFGSPVGQWVDVATPAPVTFDHLDLQLVADGRHSVPTQVRVDAGGEARTVEVPPVADVAAPDGTVSVPVRFAPLTGSDVRVTVTGVRETTTTEYHELQPIVMPVAIAEVGLPGVRRAPLPTALPSVCRTDLLTLDGKEIGARVRGTTADAVAGKPLDLAPCTRGSDATPTFDLGAGDRMVSSNPGADVGVNVDALVLGSDAGGAAMPLGAQGSLPATTTASAPGSSAPTVHVTKKGSTEIEARVTGAEPGTPFWFVLGESDNAGWVATADGKDLGTSTLVDGYANGWLVHPTKGSFTVTLRWTPQNRVWIALVLSAVALVLCLFLALRGRRARRRARDGDDASVAFDGVGELASPLLATGRRPRVGATVAGVLAVGVAGAVLARWWVGVLAALGTLAVLLWPRLRPVLTLGAPAALGLCALYVIVQQYRHAYVSDLDWPARFDRINDVAWLAVILLLADAAVELLRQRAANREREPAASGVASPAEPPAGEVDDE